MKVSDYVKKLRKEKGLRIVDYCDQLNISHTHLTKIENGYMDNPSPTMAARLCRMLDIEPSELKKFDFNPDQQFIDNVKKRLEEKDITDVSFAVATFEREQLPFLYTDKDFKPIYSYASVLINEDKFNPSKKLIDINSIYSTSYDATTTNLKNGRPVEIFYIPTRKLRKFSYKFDSLCKNVPDFVTNLISALTYPAYSKNPKEIYFITTSENIYNTIKDCFPHPIETTGLISKLCYVDPKNKDKHQDWPIATPIDGIK